MDTHLNPRITVIMPAYNAAAYIQESIESILQQSYSRFILLIIDDGSSDDTSKIVNSFHDSRIKVIRNSVNKGIVDTRNIGLETVTTEYIAMLDADDVSHPLRFEKQIQLLDSNPQVDVVASFIQLIDQNGNSSGVWKEDRENIAGEEIKNTLPYINCIGQSSVMLRKKSLKGNRYKKEYHSSEDWGLWLDLLSDKCIFAKIDEQLVSYRLHSSNITKEHNNKGVLNKVIRFKQSYLAESIKHKKFRTIERKMLGTLTKDIFNYIIPPLFVSRLRKLLSPYPFLLIASYLKALVFFNRKRKYSHVFFFPYYHIGGAEKIHAAIVESVADQNTLVLFTGESSGNAFLNSFNSNATTLDVHHLLNNRRLRNWVRNKTLNLAEQSQPVLFGCNSHFYYELIAFSPKHARCIDLIHAFVHEHEDGPEKWSVPVVDRLTARVVISPNTREQLKELYKKNNIPPDLIDRVICINNFTERAEYVEKQNRNLECLYVGRGSEEKRVNLISKAAALSAQANINASFIFVGSVGNAIPSSHRQYITIIDELNNSKEVNKHYQKADVLLMASSREGFPLVIMEAMMNGVVPVVSGVGGIPSFITDRQNGILLNPDEATLPEEMMGVIDYLDKSRNELSRLSKNAREYALQHFDKETFVSSYRKLLLNK